MIAAFRLADIKVNDHSPVCGEQLFFPLTEQIERLVEGPGDGRRLTLAQLDAGFKQKTDAIRPGRIGILGDHAHGDKQA